MNDEFTKIWEALASNTEDINKTITMVYNHVLDLQGNLATLYMIVNTRLASLTFIPEAYVDGVEAIVFRSYSYNALTLTVYKKDYKDLRIVDEQKCHLETNPVDYHFRRYINSVDDEAGINNVVVWDDNTLMHGDNIVKIAYIKVKIVKETTAPQNKVYSLVVDDFKFVCGESGVVKTTIAQINTQLYNKIGLSKDEFHARYTCFEDVEWTNEDGIVTDLGSVKELTETVDETTTHLLGLRRCFLPSSGASSIDFSC